MGFNWRGSYCSLQFITLYVLFSLIGVVMSVPIQIAPSAGVIDEQSSMDADPTYAVLYNIWGLERTGTNFMATTIWKNIVRNTGRRPFWIHRYLLPGSALKTENIFGPMCKNRIDGANCRSDIQQYQQPVWKHFWIHKDEFFPSNVKHQHVMNPESYQRDLSQLSSFEALFKEWCGYPFNDPNLPPMDSFKHIVQIKNPYSWLNSIANNARGQRYIRTEFPVEFQQGKPYTTANLVELWIDYYSRWLDWQEQRPDKVLIVPYEHMLADFEGSVGKVFEHLDLATPHDTSGNVMFGKPARVAQSPRDSWTEDVNKYIANKQPAITIADTMTLDNTQTQGAWITDAVRKELAEQQLHEATQTLTNSSRVNAAYRLLEHFGYRSSDVGLYKYDPADAGL